MSRRMGSIAAGGLLIASLAVPAAARGSGPAYQVLDVTNGIQAFVSSHPQGYVDLGGIVLFTARDDEHGNELWRTDGTAAGTIRLTDLAPGLPDGVVGTARAVHDGVLYFPGADGVWRSDGTEGGTWRVSPLSATTLAVAGDALYVFAGPIHGDHAPEEWTALWRIALADGTATRLADFPRGPGSGRNLAPSPTVVGPRLFFAADVAGEEGLWITDGTPAGTRRLRAVMLGNRYDGNGSTHLVAAGDQLFVIARDAAGWELWRSDGTEAGTRRVRDINPGSADGIHFNYEAATTEPFFAVVDDTLFFVANDGANGRELWRSDGTEEGTRQVADIAPGPLGIDGIPAGQYADAARWFIQMLPTPGRLYLTARPSGTALELWESDGTAAGTRFVATLSGDALREVREEPIGTILRFTDGPRVWASDGTADGTVVIATAWGHISEFTPALGGAIFTAHDGLFGTEPWVSDFTSAGTHLLADLARGNPDLDPAELTDLNGTLLFVGQDGVHGRELWRSDGTAAGTRLVVDVAPGNTSSYPTNLVVSEATLYFTADDGTRGHALWRSDGTSAGTALVRADLADRADFHLVPDGRGGVWVFAGGPEHPHALWHSDGTTAGTRLVQTLERSIEGSHAAAHPAAVLGDTLLFRARDAQHGEELWRSDGTATGTWLVADLQPGEASSAPGGLTALGELVVFFATDEAYRTALWRTDGTAAGTVRLASVGHLASGPAVAADGRMVFAAWRDSAYGVRLWQTDGTPQGTFVINEDARTAPSVAAAGGELFAVLAITDYELHRIGCGGELMAAPVLSQLRGFGDRLLFVEPGDYGAMRLWTSDGTTAGTVLLHELAGIPDDVRPRPVVEPEFTRAGAHVFFVGEHDAAGRELWALPVSALPVVEPAPCPPTPTPTARPTPPLPGCPDGSARCTAVAVDAAPAHPGETTVITATLYVDDGPIVGIQNDLAFPPGMIVPPAADGRPDCRVEPDIDKHETAFAYAPGGCTPGEDCTGLRAFVLSFTNLDPIPDGAVLYTCTLAIAADAAAGVYPLMLSELAAADDQGNEVPLAGIHGEIEVRGESGTRGAGVAGGGGHGCQTAAPQGSAWPLAIAAIILLAGRRIHRSGAKTQRNAERLS